MTTEQLLFSCFFPNLFYSSLGSYPKQSWGSSSSSSTYPKQSFGSSSSSFGSSQPKPPTNNFGSISNSNPSSGIGGFNQPKPPANNFGGGFSQPKNTANNLGGGFTQPKNTANSLGAGNTKGCAISKVQKWCLLFLGQKSSLDPLKYTFYNWVLILIYRKKIIF